MPYLAEASVELRGIQESYRSSLGHKRVDRPSPLALRIAHGPQQRSLDAQGSMCSVLKYELLLSAHVLLKQLVLTRRILFRNEGLLNWQIRQLPSAVLTLFGAWITAVV